MSKTIIYRIGLVLLCVCLPQSGQASWPGFRGPLADYRAKAPWEAATGVALDVQWKKSIGSGYSQVAVDGDQVIVSFTDGDRDVLASLDAVTGDEHWRYDTGEVWRGREGSLDGPISTPAKFAAELGIQVETREHPAGTGWGSWQNDLPDLLARILPYEGE